MMQADLVTRLVAAALPAVGANIAWGERAQGTPIPGIVLQLVSPGQDYVHAGPDGLVSPRVQASIYARTPTEAATIAAAYCAEMHMARTTGGTAFSRSVKAAERGPIVEDVGAGGKASRHDVDFYVWCSPA